jgi:hypothetical protein
MNIHSIARGTGKIYCRGMLRERFAFFVLVHDKAKVMKEV